MGVNKNPYIEWNLLRDASDYRSTDTQNISYVRQQLQTTDYLRNTSRVNMGPMRNKRALEADNSVQIPSVYASESMWGTQNWTKYITELTSSELITGDIYIGEVITPPGSSYYPYNKVGGATNITLQKTYTSTDFLQY